MVAAQLDALQRNDWPDTDAGVRAAFDFSKPRDAEKLLPGQARRRAFDCVRTLQPQYHQSTLGHICNPTLKP